MSTSPEIRALELATAACSHADGVDFQATAEVASMRSARMGAGHLLYQSQVENAQVILRAVVEGAEGVAYTNDLSAEGLRRARDRAYAAASAMPKDPGHPGLPSPEEAGEAASTDACDELTAAGDAMAENRALASALEACRAHGSTLAGIVGQGSQTRAVVNTRGLERSTRWSIAHARLVASNGPGSGHGGQLCGRSSELDLRDLGDKAGACAKASSEPQDLAPGRYDVVLEPPAVIELLEWLGMIAFGAHTVEEGRSFLAGRMGESITGSLVTLYDPGPDTDLLPVSFDQEGVARSRVDFVVEGKARGVVHDRATASRGGCASTGHWGVNDRFPVDGPSPGAIVMATGTDTGSLVDKLEHGLHVHRLHYVNGMLDPSVARMTGLTRDGLFEIRDGQVHRAIRDLRFTENILEAFGRIEGITDTLGSVASFWIDSGGAYRAPSLLLRDFHFTGTCTA